MVLLVLIAAFAVAQDPMAAGRDALQRADYPKAEEIYRAYVKQNPRSAEGLSNLAAVLARREKFDEAIATYQRALRADPKLTPIWFNLGVAYLRAGRYGEAVPALETFLKTHSDDLRARQLLGICMVETGDFRGGIPQLERVQAARPADVSALYALASAHIRAGDETRGAELLDQLERLNAQPALVHLLKGLMLDRLKEYDRSEPEFQEALKLDPANAAALAALGRLRLRVNDDTPAIAYFEKALKIAPQDAESQYQLGVLLDRNGRSAKGRTRLKRAMVLRADYPDPMYWLAKIDFRDGNARAALPMAEAAVKYAPEQEAIHLLLARIYQALGSDAKAKAEFAEVRRLQQLRLHRKPIGEEPALPMVTDPRP